MVDLKDLYAVIFDMDGLIFDTEILYEKAFLDEAYSIGLVSVDRQVARAMVGLSWPATREFLVRLFPSSVDVDGFIANWTDAYDQLCATQLKLKPGVRELLTRLDELDLICAIATGSHRLTAESHLERHGLLGHFAALIASEDCAEGKPSPEPFLKAAKILSVNPTDCLALEDSINGIRSAHSAGMISIMVPDLVYPNTQTPACCAHIVETLHDVLPLIGSSGET